MRDAASVIGFLRSALQVALITALLAFTATAQTQQRQSQTHVISARVGEVTRVEGEVWLRRGERREQQTLRVGERLADTDVVITGMSGRAEWTLTPGSVLQIGPRSQVDVFSADPDHLHFDIERGEVYAVMGSITQGTLELDTPPARLSAIKSGGYRVRVAADEATEAAVARGELQFTDNLGKTISVTRRRRVRFAPWQRRKIWDAYRGK